MSHEDPQALDLLEFWQRAGYEAWFAGGEAFDDKCERWRPLMERARAGELDDWAQTAAGALALILLLDQFPRNLLRGTPEQFASDGKALEVAAAALSNGFDKSQPMPSRIFYYLPFEHSEDMADQDRMLDLVRPLGNQDAYYYALIHADPIRRFGRFPHRNKILGRQSTPEEEHYLATGGFGA